MTAVDLDTCALEPIHIPGQIQPHGALLAVDEDELTVVLASENVGDVLGRPHAAIVGARLGALFDDASRERLRRVCATGSLARLRPAHVVVEGRDFDAIVHRSGGLLVVELEPRTLDEAAQHVVYDLGRQAVGRMQGARTIDELWPIVVDEVKHVTGFDRVMVYHFDERDEHGEVVAEALDPASGREPYLGLHYPASDVPAQARQLYALSWLRLIPDVSYRPSPVLPAANPKTGDPLDMSHAALRSVSPIHVEYLVNMGVSASLSISLVRDARLWGLIACHHFAPRLVPYCTRLACELMAQVCSLLLDPLERAELSAHRVRAQEVLAGLVRRLAGEVDFHAALLRGAPNLLDLVPADAVAVAYAGRVETRGPAPSPGEIEAILRWLGERGEDDVFATDALSAELPAAIELVPIASGLLAVPIARASSAYVLWFRPEWVRAVRWGGDPNTPLRVGPQPDRLYPRRSFAAWEQIVERRARPWTAWEVEAARALRLGVVGIVLEKAAEVATLNVSLNAAVRSRDEFLSVASHELRTPMSTLGVLIGSLRRACERDQLNPEKICKMLDIATRQVDRLDHLVGELLEVSRIAAGRLDLHITDVDLVAVARAAIDRFSVAASMVGSTLTLLAPGPVRGRWDESRLDQVVNNLISNAIKYGGGSPIEVHVEASEAGAVVRVIDRGEGIPEDAMQRIFERFERASAPGSVAGFGLGLWIARKFIERHGGSIGVDSRVGAGSTFTVRLPWEAP